MKTAGVKHLLRLAILQALLAGAFAVSVAAFKTPLEIALLIYLIVAILILLFYFILAFAQSRGVLPRGIPIKPFRASSLAEGEEGKFYLGDRGDPARTSKDRVIEDYIETSRSLIGSERYEESAELLRKALEIDPYNSRMLNYLGICLSRMSRYEEAAKVYEACIEQDYDNASAHFNLAVALENVERVSAAIAQYQRYMKIGRIVGEPEEMLKRATDRLRCLRGA